MGCAPHIGSRCVVQTASLLFLHLSETVDRQVFLKQKKFHKTAVNLTIFISTYNIVGKVNMFTCTCMLPCCFASTVLLVSNTVNFTIFISTYIYNIAGNVNMFTCAL